MAGDSLSLMIISLPLTAYHATFKCILSDISPESISWHSKIWNCMMKCAPGWVLARHVEFSDLRKVETTIGKQLAMWIGD